MRDRLTVVVARNDQLAKNCSGDFEPAYGVTEAGVAFRLAASATISADSASRLPGVNNDWVKTPNDQSPGPSAESVWIPGQKT
jgi:hypothetical protein